MRRRSRVLRPPGCRGLAVLELPPSCPSWCRVAHRPHHPARGLLSNNTTRQHPPETDRGSKAGGRIGAAPGSRASLSPSGEVAVAPLCVPCSPLVLHPGALLGVLAEEWGFVCLKGPFSPGDFSLAFLHSLLQASGKTNGIGARFDIRGQLLM